MEIVRMFLHSETVSTRVGPSGPWTSMTVTGPVGRTLPAVVALRAIARTVILYVDEARSDGRKRALNFPSALRQ